MSGLRAKSSFFTQDFTKFLSKILSALECSLNYLSGLLNFLSAHSTLKILTQIFEWPLTFLKEKLSVVQYAYNIDSFLHG